MAALFFLLLHVFSGEKILQYQPSVFWELSSKLETIPEQIQNNGKGQFYFYDETSIYQYNGIALQNIATPLPSSPIESFHVTDSIFFIQQEDQLFVQSGEDTRSISYSNTISRVIQLNVASYLICSQEGGCSTLQLKEELTVEPEVETENYIINDAHPTQNGYVLATDNGILIVSEQGARHLSPKDGLPDYIVEDISITGATLFGRCYDQSMFSLNLSTGEITALPGFPNAQINDISLFQGNYYIASSRGLFVLKDEKWEQMVSENIEQILIGKQELFWTLTTTGDMMGWPTSYSLHPKETEYNTHCLAVVNNKLWEGRLNDIRIYNNFYSDNSDYKTVSIETNKPVTGIVELNNRVIATTLGGGMFVLNKQGEKQLRLSEENGLLSNHIVGVYQEENMLWLITLKGLSQINLADFSIKNQFYSGEELPATFIYDLSKKGQYLLATDGQGILHWEITSNTTTPISEDYSEAVAYRILSDTNNTYFSLANEGVFRMNKEKNTSAIEGLQSKNILNIVKAANHIYFIHESGVDVYNPENSTIHPVHLEEQLELDLHASTVFKDHLIVAYQNKFLMVNIQQEYSLPEIELHEISPSYNTRKQNKRVFKNSDNTFNFSFTGTWNRNPDNLQYAYRLKGLDSNWIYTKENRVFYNELRHGDYEFQVGSVLADNSPPSQIEKYSFTIQKPFYLQTVFWLPLLILFVLSLLLLQNIREKAVLRRQNIEKARLMLEFNNLKNQVNPHFLHNSFNSLTYLIEENPSKAVDYVQKLSRFFRKSFTLTQSEIIPLKEELKLVNDYIDIQKQRYGKNLKIFIDIPNPESIVVIPMVLQTLVENAVKHNIISEAKPLSVTIRQTENFIVVENNKQLRKLEQSTKTGLRNISSQYKHLSKRAIEMNDREEKFQVKIPILRN